MNPTTASALALLHECGYSFRPDVETPPDAPRAASSRGTVFGLLAEDEINGTKTDKLALVEALPEDERERLTRMWAHAVAWIREHRKLGWRAEQAFAWEPATDVGRELPRKTHRDYSDATATELCGTADIVWIDGDTVCVADWKTTTDGAPEVDATAQLEGLALMAARAWGYDSARIVTLKVTEHGVEPIDGEPLDVFGLAEVAERIRTDLARVANAEPVEGEHCRKRYCKALAVCPKTAALVEQIIPADTLARQEWSFSPTITSPDHCERILAMLPIATEYLERVKRAIVAYVADGPVKTSDGREIYQAFRTMTRTNAGAVLELAKQLGATDERLALCARAAQEPNGVKVRGGKRGKAAA